MNFKAIRHTQQDVWPTVRDSLDRVRKARDLVKNDPHASPASVTRSKIHWNRVVANETVWAIAHANLLATPEQAAVIEAAKAWVQTWKEEGMVPSTGEGDHVTDVNLYRAVQELVATFEVPDHIG